MTFTYPGSDFDRSKLLLSLVGSYWARVYEGVNTVESILFARAQQEAQAHLDLLELIRCTSRYDVPLFHRDNWQLLTLRESELNGPKTSLLRFGDDAVFGHQPDGTYYLFGVPFGKTSSAFPLPEKLAECQYIFNRITEPSRSLTHGVDFTLDRDRQAIIFRDNPFADDLIPRRDVVDADGNVVDRECALWLFHGEFDLQYAYRHFGYLLGLQLQSSEEYKQLINAILDAAVGGTAQEQLESAVSALTGVPLVRERVETVEVVTQDAQRTLIVTDQHVYRFPLTAVPLVAVGDVVAAGDPLVEAIRFYELNRGQVPAGLRSLAVGKQFLGQAFFADLTFSNETVPLIVEEDVDGYTKVSFAVSGWPLDVEKFWNDVHAKGIAAGETLAHLLDVRQSPTGEPTADSLPATVNPLQFLIANVLRNNASIVIIKAAQLDTNGLGLAHARWLRKIIPPQSYLFVVVELEVSGDTITMDGPGTATRPGYSESPDTLIGLEPIAETISHTQITENPTISLVSDHCQ